MGLKRTRNWGTIIYPRQAEGEETTCPDNWVEILEELAVKCVVSPLHDKDIDTKTGKLKKAHRHVLVAFDGVKTEAQAREVFDRIGGVGCEPISSLYSQTRYLTHLDNPEKAQYSVCDVLTFGGFDYGKYGKTKEDEEREIIGNMGKIFNIVAEKSITEFSDLAEILMFEQDGNTELFSTLRKNPYFFSCFLKSKNNITKKTLEEYENRM